MKLVARALAPVHDRESFDCGDPLLNAYLQRQASQDVRRQVARIFVAAESDSPRRVLGYYALSAASFDHADLPIDVAKRLPRYPVPAALLGRLAVDLGCQGQGIGEWLVLDAFRRVLQASAALAVHAVIVDSKNEVAARFYARFGFRALPTKPARLFIPTSTIAKLEL